MVLMNLPGIERLMKRLDNHFGGRHELIRTLESGEFHELLKLKASP